MMWSTKVVVQGCVELLWVSHAVCFGLMWHSVLPIFLQSNFWSLSHIALYHAKAGLWQKGLNTQYLLLVLIFPVLGQ